MSKEIVLASVCMHVEHDKPGNLRKYIEFINEAAEKDAQLIAFPECSLQGYTWSYDERGFFSEDKEQQRYFREVSEPIPGPCTAELSKYATSFNMYIQAGMAEKGNDNKLYNAAVLIGPKGIVGVHRKVHMAPNPVFSCGDRFSVYDTEIGRIGSIVCADLCYPESVRVHALQGAEIIVNSTAWGLDVPNSPVTEFREYSYDLMSRANAILNRVWFISADQVGAPTRCKHESNGHSCIIDPMGKIIADTGREEGLITASVDVKGALAKARSARYLLSSLDHRHPECYGIICEKRNKL